MERFVVRPDDEGFSVIDIWSGEPTLIAMARQTGLPEADAEHTAALLNHKAAGAGPPPARLGPRSTVQA